MDIIINGACGRMGRMLSAAAAQNPKTRVVAGVDIAESAAGCDYPIYALADECSEQADVIIDFSLHSAVGNLLNYAVKRKLSCVIASTAHTADELELIKKASESIPVFLSSNLSLGVAYMCETVKKLAAAFPDAEIEIIETHHNKKLDSPSGTAVMLANAIKKVRPEAVIVCGRSGNHVRGKDEIGINSVRIGNIVGVHEVIINDGSEAISIKHEAYDRSLFAKGALIAAEFLLNMGSGLYDMESMF